MVKAWVLDFVRKNVCCDDEREIRRLAQELQDRALMLDEVEEEYIVEEEEVCESESISSEEYVEEIVIRKRSDGHWELA
jgi:hypothetical protein